jgi:V8-like Glu-specific endopeptidase
MFARLILFITLLMAPHNANMNVRNHTNASVDGKSSKNSTILQQVALKDKKLRTDARKAAVSVITPYGSGSGTYFKIGDDYIVITAYHVVEEQDVVLIVGRNNEQVYGQPIVKSFEGDVAVLIVPRMSSVKPMKLRPLPEKAKNNVNKLVGDEVTYTGFPGHHDLLTVDGKIANLENGYIIMHSYGWPGSSGAGVFDF